MLAYRLLLLAKLAGVSVFAGGVVATVIAPTRDDRRRAVHRVASPGLVVIWIAGYLLARRTLVPLGEAWIAGAIGLSLVCQLALVHAAARERRSAAALAVAVAAFAAILVLMVFRPTWSRLGA